MPATQYISDVVAGGHVVAGGPGEGPDGAVLVVWDAARGDNFAVWSTHDGATWNEICVVRSERPIDLFRACLVAQQVLQQYSADPDFTDMRASVPTALVVLDGKLSEIRC